MLNPNKPLNERQQAVFDRCAEILEKRKGMIFFSGEHRDPARIQPLFLRTDSTGTLRQ